MYLSKISQLYAFVIFAIVSFCMGTVAQSPERTIYAFSAPAPGCWDATAPLIADSDGNLYGTALGGGTNGYGCVFELSSGAGGWQYALLYSFSGSDGDGPAAALVFDKLGNLYGTTERGGAYDSGVAFQLSPSGSGTWTETVLHSFGSGDDGGAPASNLIFDQSGNIYGTTIWSGGNLKGGIVFRLSPGESDWIETILYSFPASISGPDGDRPVGGVVVDGNGNLYGNTLTGGKYGNGAVYELSPSGTSYKEKIIYSFNLYDGSEPTSGIVMDKQGNIYGTTLAGGDTNACAFVGCGLVFELTKGATGKWTENILLAMKSTDGAYPVGPVVFDGAGNLYAAALTGGKYADGSVFLLAPTSSGPWKETVLHEFDYQPWAGHGTDGATPYAGVIVRSGRVFGTTALGGSDDDGTVFEIAAGRPVS